ncbi:MAG: KilA-N domain-containing protein, partial [Anaeroplasmataceae bacterium]|nr:KilA-N domain-containing protein [Anaeroplasmataceae bacterium]
MGNKEVLVKGIYVKYQAVNQEDYICLTDIAKVKNLKEPKDVIKSWMRSRSTLEYLS